MFERKINILFVIMQMEMGGSERLVHNLITKIDRDLFAPSVAWFYGEEILEDFKNLNVPLYHVPKIRSFDLTTMKKMGDIIINNNIHIVNAHHFMSMVYLFYGCKMKRHIKLFYTEHSEWEIEKISWKWKKAGNHLLKHIDGAVGVSSKVSKLMQKRFKLSPDKVLTIENGVDLETFSIDTENKMAIRRELGIEDNEKVVGIVANFKKIKNHILLLRAFDKLANVSEYVKLIMVGQGFEDDPENSEKDIRSFVAQNGLSNRVLFLGYRSDVSDLLGIMDIFCLTSLKEGLPISLIEAMAAGLPVVGTDVEGIKDVVVNNKNGLLIQLDDVDGLKEVLHRLLHDDSLREKYGNESKSMTTNTYSLKKCVNEYQDLFLSVLGNKKHNRVY